MNEITEPANKVEPLEVRFESQGVRLVGHLYQPARNACQATSHRGGATLAECQGAGRNQRRLSLAERGLIAVAFDFRHWGDSGGEPRELESPAETLQDIKRAVAFLQSRPEVDAGRIGELGICFGAGYARQASHFKRSLVRKEGGS